MADNMIFPIHFDLEKGVEDAGKDWEKKYAKKLEDYMAKRPVSVKLNLDFKDISDVTARISGLTGASPKVTPKLDTSSFDGALKSLQKSLEGIDTASLTEHEASAIKTLTGAVNSLARAYSEKNKAAALEDKATQELKAATATEKRAKAELATVKAAEQRSKKETNLAIAKANQAKAEENATAAVKRRMTAEENLASAQNRRLITERNLAASTARMEKAQLALIRAQDRSASSTRSGSKAFLEQGGYLQRLTQRMAAYWSVHQVGTFLTSVREVTAQFELQRVSLGAIIQDQTRANALFSEIKGFALKSPVSIMDLTKYTKQLAAYKIGVDELFETTKKLTDVSVGLGVSMDRVVLAYGQTRATGYLRASEIRQFTEMGVPIVEELAEKLSKMNGELVTAADVMDLVSKRGISFELVKEVFDDMTSAGGIFYDMQEKQGNTLFGLWAKMGDAASVMYDEIGNTESVNEGMKSAILALTEFMRNWRAVGATLWTAGLGAGAYIASRAFTKYAFSAEKIAAAETRAKVAAEARKAAVLQLNAAIEKGTTDDINAANAALRRANAEDLAARKGVTQAGLAINGLKSLVSSAAVGLGIGYAVTAVTALTYKLFEAVENAKRLQRALDGIEAERVVETAQSVRNFEYLADAAVHAADGSKEQKDRLDELQRTFKDILPVEDMSIENLRRLRAGTDSASEGYRTLTDSIREYMAEQARKKALDEANNEYMTKTTDAMKALSGWFKKQGLGAGEKMRFFEALRETSTDASKDLKAQIVAAFDQAGIEGGEALAESLMKEKSLWQKSVDKFVLATAPLSPSLATGGALIKGLFPEGHYISDIIRATREYGEALNGIAETYDKIAGKAGKYGRLLEGTRKHMAEYRPVGLDDNSWAYRKAVDAEQIREWGRAITEALKEENVRIENEWFNIDKGKAFRLSEVASINIDAIKEALGTGHPEIQKMLGAIQKEYDEIVPKDAVVKRVRGKFDELAAAMNITEKVRGSVMGTAEGLESYRKKINELAKDYTQQVKNLTKVMAGMNMLTVGYVELSKKLASATDLKDFFTKMSEFLGKDPASGGEKSDKRLETLKRVSGAMREMYTRYKELEKAIGSSRAGVHAAETYRQELEYLNALVEEFGIKLDVPKTIKDLNRAQTLIYNAITTLKPTEATRRAAIDLGKTMDSDWMKAQTEVVEARLKELADRISRTKTAKEFYDKILGMTGDVELAANVAIHVYGEQRKDLDKQIREQIEKLLEPSGIKIDESIFREDGTFDPKKLREFAEAQKDALGGIESKAYQELMKLSDNADKDFAKTIEGWLKAIEKAKSASDKMLDLARTTRTEIDKITAQKGYAQTRITELLGLGTRTDEQQQELENLQGFLDVADKLIQGFKDKQTKEQTSLAYEMFKDSPMYVQMFDDLDHASTAMLENMKTRIDGLKGAWKDLTPTQLKELQSRMNEIDAQLAKRNPFKTLAKSISDYRKLRREGDSRGNKSEGAANADLMAASKAADEARKKYDELVKKYGKGSEKSVQEVIDAKDKLDRAMANEEAAQKAVENWKKVKDMIGLSANELFQMMNWGADIARGIADISEAMGADEEDVQYWNDVADALSDISGGIQDIVSAAMSGNVVGIISSVLTAVPKMFVGFANLFSAGKIKRANKEIKRQQELLEQLEYTYGRLEKMADKLFGRDYLNNYTQRLRNLQAQQEAYLKQAEAERSKGKKADKEKIKEYEEQARETADNIKELQDDLASHFTGSGKTDVARQMAKSWIDARASMSDTFAAIKGDYADMIKNMIVEGAAARIIENALTPVWNSMEAMLEKNDVEGAIDSLVNGMDSALNAANNGMEVLWKALEARGYDMKKLIGDTDREYTGIAKNIAGATSEEILQLSGFVNTALYHTAYLPKIYEELVAMRTASFPTATVSATSAGWTDWQQQAMDNYNAIARNTADTVVECRRAAEACEKMTRLIKTKGSTSGLNVFLN